MGLFPQRCELRRACFREGGAASPGAPAEINIYLHIEMWERGKFREELFRTFQDVSGKMREPGRGQQTSVHLGDPPGPHDTREADYPSAASTCRT